MVAIEGESPVSEIHITSYFRPEYHGTRGIL